MQWPDRAARCRGFACEDRPRKTPLPLPSLPFVTMELRHPVPGHRSRAAPRKTPRALGLSLASADQKRWPRFFRPIQSARCRSGRTAVEITRINPERSLPKLMLKRRGNTMPYSQPQPINRARALREVRRCGGRWQRGGLARRHSRVTKNRIPPVFLICRISSVGAGRVATLLAQQPLRAIGIKNPLLCRRAPTTPHAIALVR